MVVESYCRYGYSFEAPRTLGPLTALPSSPEQVAAFIARAQPTSPQQQQQQQQQTHHALPPGKVKGHGGLDVHASAFGIRKEEPPQRSDSLRILGATNW